MPYVNYNSKETWNELYKVFPAKGEIGDIVLGYNRAALFDTLFKEHAKHVPPALGWGEFVERPTLDPTRVERVFVPATDMKIVVIGAGFGWFEEHLRQMGYRHIVSVDTSTLIHALKDSDEDDDIDAACARAKVSQGRRAQIRARLRGQGPRCRVNLLNADVMTSAGRALIRQTLGAKPDYVYSENVLEALTDEECIGLSLAMRTLGDGAPVAHLVMQVGYRPGTSEAYDDGNPFFPVRSLHFYKDLLDPDVIIEDAIYRVL